jgi:hypothetical protein
MSQDWEGIQQGNSKYKAEIVKVGLEHSLATQYTSFVAVEERTVVQDGKPVRIEVPVELPQGVSPLAVPGGNEDQKVGFFKSQLAAPAPASPQSFGYAGSVNQTVTVDAEQIQNLPLHSGVTLSTLAPGVLAPGKPDKDLAAKNKLVEAKLSPGLLALYQCAAHRRTGATTTGCKAVDAPINVQVELTVMGPQIVQKLLRAGFKIASGAGTTQITGSIQASQLRLLAEIAEVKSVSQMNNK